MSSKCLGLNTREEARDFQQPELPAAAPILKPRARMPINNIRQNRIRQYMNKTKALAQEGMLATDVKNETQELSGRPKMSSLSGKS